MSDQDENIDPHGGWPAPDRVGLTFSDPDDHPDGAHAEYVRADIYAGAVGELREFQEGLTTALNDHGVPAMPSWREAIDWLAAHGGQ